MNNEGRQIISRNMILLMVQVGLGFSWVRWENRVESALAEPQGLGERREKEGDDAPRKDCGHGLTSDLESECRLLNAASSQRTKFRGIL